MKSINCPKCDTGKDINEVIPEQYPVSCDACGKILYLTFEDLRTGNLRTDWIKMRGGYNVYNEKL